MEFTAKDIGPYATYCAAVKLSNYIYLFVHFNDKQTVQADSGGHGS
jgi:hypothetical protein